MRHFAELTGYSRDELQAREFTWAMDLTPPEWRAAEAEVLTCAVQEREAVRYEKEYLRKDGTRVPIELFVQPVFDEAGSLVHYRSFLTDITERKRAEEELQHLLEESQAQSEELQAQSEELQAQSEELRTANEELLEGQERITRESELRSRLVAIGDALHSTLQIEEVMSLAMREATAALDLDAAAIELEEKGAWPVRYTAGLPSAHLGWPLGEHPVIARLVAGSGNPLVLDVAARDEQVGRIAVRHGIRSLIAVPLVARDQVFGMLLLADRKKPRHFAAAEIDFARGLGTTVGLAIDTARLYQAELEVQEQLRQELESTSLLVDAGAALTSWTDLDGMLESLADLLLRSTDHSRILLELWDEERREVEVAVSRGTAATPKQRFAFDGISDGAKEVITTKETLVVDYAMTGIPRPQKEYVDEHAFRLMLVVPIVYRKQLIGLITADQPGEARPFSPKEIQLVEAVAAQAGAAIENAQLFEAKEDELSRTATLREIAAAAAGTIDQRELSAQVLDACRRRLGAKAGNVYVFDRKAGVLRASALFGFPEGLMPQMERMDLDEARASARSYLRGEVVTHDSPDLPSGISERAKAAEATQDRWVSLPIRARDEVVGSLGLIFPGQRAFGAEEIALYQALADQLGVGLDKAQLFEAEAAARQEAAQELETTTFLLEAADELNKWTDLDVLLDRLADIALRATLHSRVHVAVLCDDRSHVTFRAARGEDAVPSGTVVPLDQLSAAVQEALTTGRTRAFETVKLADRERGLLKEGIRGRPALVVPIVFGGRIVGYIAVDDPTERYEFTDRDSAIFEGIAAQAAVAIENARVFEREREARKLNSALAAIDGVIHSSLDFTTVMQTALREGAAALGAETAAANMHDNEMRQLRVAYVHNYPEDKVGSLVPDADDTHGVEAMRTGRTLAIDDTQSDPRVVHEFVDAWNIKSVICAPLIVKGNAIAVAYFNYHTAAHQFSAQETDFVTKLASSLSTALENAQLYEREAETARLATALNEMNLLINSTLDAREIRQTALERAVAAIGTDSAMVALRHGDDWVVEFGYPEVPGVIHESFKTNEVPFVLTALAERRPVAIDDCDSDPRCIPQVQRRFGVRSVLCLPLIVRDEVLGVIFFNQHHAAVHFPPAIVEFAGKLAVAISTALGNAQLYEEQQRIATTLQENFLHPLPQIPGLELATRSLPANSAELVGGDFSDVFALPDGKVAVLIGDVAGKGLRAAGLTETVRSTVRAFSGIDSGPAFILRKANELLLRHEAGEPHVTACLCLIDPETGHVSVASAGHPGPIHLTADSCQLFEPPFSPPLGTFPSDYVASHLTLTLDDYLVLYTDGVTEARRDGELFGEDRLVEVVERLRGSSAEDMAQGVADAALAFGGQLRDDLQIVVVRLA